MKAFIYIFLLLRAGTAFPATLILSEVEQSTLRAHPALRAAHARWVAARERVPQAKAWDDPMFGLELEQSDGRSSRIADAEWMLSQKLPLSGRPQAQGRVAEAEAAIIYEDVKRVRAELLMRVRTAYVAYASAQERLVLNAQNQRILSEIIAITQHKLETGEAMLADSLQAEAEAAMLEDKRADLEREREQSRVMLNTLMQRPVDAPLADPAPLVFEPLPQSAAQMMGAALQYRPDLLSAQRQVEADTQKIDLAKRQRRPDPSIVVFGRQLNGQGAGIQEVDVGFSMPLTFFNRRKYDAAVREAEAMREASAETMKAVRLDTLEAVRLKHEAASAAAKRYLILRDKVIPQAQKALEARATDFASRKASFLEYNAVRLLLQTAQMEQFDRLTTYQTALAELRTLTQEHRPSTEAPPRALPVP